jgi:CelD/BcsL family acetyltransferase involved in cellulose biosynthesis
MHEHTEAERTNSSLPKPRCQVGIVDSDAGLASLEPQWNTLLKQSNATVFQSFEWVTSCWKYFADGARLHCLTFHVDERLVGLAPLCRRTIRYPFPICSVLEFIGRPHGDYNDFIVAPGFEQAVVEAFIDHFSSGSSGADVVDFDEIPPASCLAQYLIIVAGQCGLDAVEQQGVVCPYIQLPSTFEEFLKSLGPNTRYNYKRKRTKLSEHHQITERIIRDTGSTLEEGIASFIRIHSERWKGLGFPSLYERPALRDFIMEVCKRIAQQGWLRLYLLAADGIDVAASLEFLHGGRVFMYNSNASGPSDIMKHSPGLLIKFSAIRQGIEEHMREYDMLRGEESYKSDNLKALERFNATFRLGFRTRAGKLRSRLYLGWLLQKKAVGRTRLEYHEWRRFSITKHPNLLRSAGYFMQRASTVGKMFASFVTPYLHRQEKSTL